MKVAVSDGCSSGARTDVGARVVALAALAPSQMCIPSFRRDAQDRFRIMSSVSESLGLQRDDMLATCVFASVTPNSGRFTIYGDGVVATQGIDGTIRMTKIEWANNLPYYLAYSLNFVDELAFFEAHGGMAQAAVTVEDCTYSYNGMVTAAGGAQGIVMSFDIATTRFAAVFSDGVTQIDGVDWKDAVREFLQFRTTGGEFVKRRMMFGLKQMKANGSKGPVDDIACAVIHVEHDNEQS